MTVTLDAATATLIGAGGLLIVIIVGIVVAGYTADRAMKKVNRWLAMHDRGKTHQGNIGMAPRTDWGAPIRRRRHRRRQRDEIL